MWRDNGTVGARIASNRARSPAASADSAAEAAGAIASKMPSSASRWPARVAADQRREIEVVAGVHAHAGAAAGARSAISLSASSSEILMPSTFAALCRDHARADIHRARMVGSLSRPSRHPVAGERGIEHLAEPVQDHRLRDAAHSTRA